MCGPPDEKVSREPLRRSPSKGRTELIASASVGLGVDLLLPKMRFMSRPDACCVWVRESVEAGRRAEA